MGSIAVSADHLKAHLPHLRIAIVGAGIGGLSAAVGLKKAGFESVTIYEQSKAIQEVGAGIQIAPNLARLLNRWGVLDELRSDSVALVRNSLLRYADDTELGSSPFMPNVEKAYGAPLLVVHRADLQMRLLDYAKRIGVTVNTSSHVAEVDFNAIYYEDSFMTETIGPPRICIKSRGAAEGRWIEADVVIAADGIRSLCRGAMMERHGTVDQAVDTGDAAYRIVIPREKFGNDQELLKIIDDPVGRRWMGPGGHIMAYPLRNHQLYNMVLLHPSRGDVEESWTSTGPRTHMESFYSSWSPTIRKLISLVEEEEIPEWTLKIHKPLASWVEGNVALMGDACHPTLPYVAQGAAQAVEDAGVLAAVLSMTTKMEDIHTSLLVYSEIRKLRAEAVVYSATKTKASLHLPDGPEQKSRDEKIRKASMGQGANPDLWGDKSFQNWIWGTDIQQQAIDRYQAIVTEALAKKAIYHPSGKGVGNRIL